MTEGSRQGFGPDTTTGEVLEGIDLSGKLALVTGGSVRLLAFALRGSHE